jgi:lipopolysaccharide/colanic/teichoic acid biosynthesis glycosyltransferase
MGLVALAIKLTSPGPVFYIQDRVGERGKVFRMYKFRTMRQDGSDPSKPGWTTPNDPRRTPIGSLLRRLSIDELPQLIHVLRGEMSLVGPRPEMPYYAERWRQEVPRYGDRYRIRGGLTGWAQVHGLRGDTSIAERVKHDIYYVENWSLLLDFKIIVKTAFELLFHKNAY